MESNQTTTYDLNKESYTVVTPFRCIHNFDQEYTTDDQFYDTADKERLLKLLTLGFIK